MVDANTLATTFIAGMRDILTDEELAAVRAHSDPDTCLSHDYCDANEVMIWALQHHGVSTDIADENILALVNEAWSLARSRGWS